MSSDATFNSWNYAFADVAAKTVSRPAFREFGWKLETAGEAYKVAYDYFIQRGGADLLMMEEPLNNYPQAWKQYVIMGVLIAGAMSAGVKRVEYVHSGTWRKAVLGTGRADKQMAMDKAKADGVEYTNDDEAEAYCIGLYGEQVLNA